MKSIASIITLFICLFSINIATAQKTINLVLEAGHGGNDAGGIAANGKTEKELALAYALEIKKQAEAKGINVFMTREGDTKLDFSQRNEFAGKHQANVYVMVHFNYSKDVTQNGMQCFISKTNLTYENTMLSKYMSSEIYYFNKMRFLGVDSRKLKSLDDMKVPTILLELGYLSNEKDLNVILDEKNKVELCEKIVTGILQYKS
jgi:N-acetylmuramoyl-L-alanine amidase